MYAVIETGGKQYQVREGDEIYIEKLDVALGEVEFDKVILVGGMEGKDVKIGAPYVKKAKVVGVIEKVGKGKKITVFTYKPRQGSNKRKLGHRQPYAKIKIKEIISL